MSTKNSQIKKVNKVNKVNKEFKEKLEFKQNMDSDDNKEDKKNISLKLYNVFTHPIKKVPQGKLFIDFIDSLLEIFDMSNDDDDMKKEETLEDKIQRKRQELFSRFNSDKKLVDFESEIKLKTKKENKKEIRKQKKIVPLDENGTVLKKTKSKELYRKPCYEGITDEDRENEVYFNNHGNFDKNVYHRKKWSSLPSKEKKKFEKKALKMKEKYNKAYEEQKPEEKPKGPLTNYILFGMDIRKKYKADSSFKNKQPKEIMTLIGQKWKDVPQKVKDKYSTLAAKSKEEYKLKLIEYEKRQIELKKKEELENKSVNTINDEAGPAEEPLNDNEEVNSDEDSDEDSDEGEPAEAQQSSNVVIDEKLDSDNDGGNPVVQETSNVDSDEDSDEDSDSDSDSD